MSSTANFRTLLVTHLIVFGAGLVVGKNLNADELNAYRTAHETWGSKMKRSFVHVSIGVASVAVVILVVRAARK
jgi:hypothetical protein